jgi:hypothetical protein
MVVVMGMAVATVVMVSAVRVRYSGVNRVGLVDVNVRPHVAGECCRKRVKR